MEKRVAEPVILRLQQLFRDCDTFRESGLTISYFLNVKNHEQYTRRLEFVRDFYVMRYLSFIESARTDLKRFKDYSLVKDLLDSLEDALNNAAKQLDAVPRILNEDAQPAIKRFLDFYHAISKVYNEMHKEFLKLSMDEIWHKSILHTILQRLGETIGPMKTALSGGGVAWINTEVNEVLYVNIYSTHAQERSFLNLSKVILKELDEVDPKERQIIELIKQARILALKIGKSINQKKIAGQEVFNDVVNFMAILRRIVDMYNVIIAEATKSPPAHY